MLSQGFIYRYKYIYIYILIYIYIHTHVHIHISIHVHTSILCLQGADAPHRFTIQRSVNTDRLPQVVNFVCAYVYVWCVCMFAFAHARFCEFLRTSMTATFDLKSGLHSYRVAETHRIPYLYRSFSTKVTYI